MKTPTTFILYFFLIISFSNAQEICFEHKLNENFKIKTTSIVSNEDEQFGLFFFGEKTINSFLLDNKMQKITSFDFNAIRSDYPYKIEEMGLNNKFIFMFQDVFYGKIGIGTYDLQNGESKFTEEVIKLKKEVFLESFISENIAYVLTINKKSSILNLYSFNIEGEYVKNIIDLSSIRFRYWNNDVVKLSSILQKPFGSQTIKWLTKIDFTSPNSLEESSRASKIFIQDNKLKLALESNRNITQIVTIDLKDYSVTKSIFNKPFIANVSYGKKTNSFIFDNKYFGISATNRTLKLEITDIFTKKILNSYSINRNDPLPFDNAAIYFQGTGIKNRFKEVNDTNKFLNKFLNDEIAVSAYKTKDDYVVAFGSFTEGKATFGLGFGQIAAFYSYATTNSTFIKGQFDENFNDTGKEVQKTKYDLMKDYIDKNGKGKIEIIKKINQDYLYGTFDNKKNTYSLIRF